MIDLNPGVDRIERSPFASRRLWGLWDMLILDAKQFVSLLHTLLTTELAVRNAAGPLQPTLARSIDGSARASATLCEQMGLPVSKRTIENMMVDCKTVEDLHRAVQQVYATIAIELEGRKYYGPLPDLAKYYDQPKLFGAEVFDHFETANDDIYEAGMCLALERPTACVMHLMRVLEVGLASLANVLAIRKQNDWGRYIKEIGDELDRRAKASGARSEDEQFYSEAAANFDRLRRAYRNPSMHADKSYSQERAEEILIAVKSFMRHLPPRVFDF
jgi:hypothetical protein